ncbi:MAG: N-acetyltransferase [Cytophagaceae bacterium]|nr:MAG: N-acetyltransferase [Cytophagaceae bacterium]
MEAGIAAGDYEVARHTLNIPHPYGELEAQHWLALTQQHYAQGSAYPFALVLLATSELVGGMGLTPEPRFGRAEAGYWLGRPYWGQGLATEALAALLRYGFEELALHKIYATHHADNLASGRVLLKNGFVLEGKLAQHVRRDGRYLDLWQYGLLRASYQTTNEQ